MIRLESFWRRHRQNMLWALLLFVASNLFVEVVAYLAVSEFGATGSSYKHACIWDCGWYKSVVEDGYHLEPFMHEKHDAANWAFFPVFPSVAVLLKAILGSSPQIALVLTSKLFLLLGLFAFMSLVADELGAEYRLLAGVLVAFNPYIIYAHAGYSEPAFLCLSALAFWAIKREHWVWAGLLGGAMSATRVVGVLFVLAYTLAGLPIIRRLVQLENFSRYALGLLLIPLGLALFMIFLNERVGDALAFSHVQVAWGRGLNNPLVNLWEGLFAGNKFRYLAIFAVVALGMAGWLIYKKRYHYAVFLLATTLLPLSTGLDSLPRYVVWQVPFLLGLVEILGKQELAKLLGMVFSAALGAVLVLAWFMDKGFVI